MIPITDKLLDELEEKAKAAMPGPWLASWRRGYRVTTECLDGDDESSCELIARVSGLTSNVDYIAAANPKTILHLIKEIHNLRAELSREKEAVKILGHQLSIVTYDFDPEKFLGPPCGPEMLKEIMQTPAKIESAQEE